MPAFTGTQPLTIGAQYIKDFSFESPNAPQIFAPSATPPDMQMGINLLTRTLAEEMHEVVLSMKMETRIDAKVAFIIELSYAGMFTVSERPEDELKKILLTECPQMLFPFARAIMMQAIRDGGFPQVIIAPVDFAELYATNQVQATQPAA